MAKPEGIGQTTGPSGSPAMSSAGRASGLGPADRPTARLQPARRRPDDRGTQHGGGSGLTRSRRVLVWAGCAGGLLAYNWWVLVPLKPGLMTSPNELFSNLEITGQPYATAMQHADVLSGVLLIAAFLTAGRRSFPAGRRDWLAMLAFGAAGLAGGLFPEVCADGINAVCRSREWHFELPLSQYVHMVAGIFEFAAITIALFIATRRTRGSSALTARAYRRLWQGALVCYPLLGAAYLLNRMGGVMEAVFFVGFTIMVVTQVAERAGRQADLGLPAVNPGGPAADCETCGSGTF